MELDVDFSKYSLDELYSVAESIDREAYPDRAREIDQHIAEKEKELPPQVTLNPNPAGSLASRVDRLFAVVVDGLINAIACIPMILYVGLDAFRQPTLSLILGSILYGFVVVAVLHGYLLYTNAQTIGKYLMSIRIENLDGTKADWKRIVFLRMLPVTITHQLTIIGQIIVGFINPLMIFGKQRRCLHDYVAKTKVCNVARPD